MAADFIPFAFKNRFSQRWPGMQKFFTLLRQEKGETPIAAAGFCWGGLYGVHLTHEGEDTKTSGGRALVDAVFVAHPSNLTIPQDIEKVTGNLSIAIGDDDVVMPLNQVKIAQQVFKDKLNVDSEVVVYPGAKHGFSVRASRAKPDSKETKQAEEAEEQAIAWFKKQFAKT